MNLASDGSIKIACEQTHSLFLELIKAGFKRKEALDMVTSMMITGIKNG